MSDQAQALGHQFEQANADTIRVVEDCPAERWQAHHPGENRTVNVLAHHIAVGHQIIAEWVQGMATGQQLPALTMDSFTEPNAQHARQYAQVTKPEVIAALQQQGAAAAGVVRGLSEEQLERVGDLLGRPMADTRRDRARPDRPRAQPPEQHPRGSGCGSAFNSHRHGENGHQRIALAGGSVQP